MLIREKRSDKAVRSLKREEEWLFRRGWWTLKSPVRIRLVRSTGDKVMRELDRRWMSLWEDGGR